MYQQPQGATRQPTSWTLPLQFAVAGFYALQAVYSLSLPFWMGGPFTQAMSRSMQRQQQLTPSATPPPVEVTSMVVSIMGVGLWIAALGGVAISVVVIVGALKRWLWMYYVVLALLALGTISAPLNLINAATGSSMNAASGFSLPAWTYSVNAIISIPTAALFVWMLVALVKRGPWGMTKTAPS
jgi:hypothetical protein